MRIVTDAGHEALGAFADSVELIEQEVCDRIQDAVRELDRYAPIPPVDDSSEATMDEQAHGDYLDREDVLAAVKRIAQ